MARLRDFSNLSKNERLIAEYVLEHPEGAARLSSRELTRRTLTSGSAVLRLVRKLGFESYHDFQLGVVDALKSADLAGTVIASGEHAITAVNKIAALEVDAVEQTKRQISAAEVEAIAECLHGCSCLDLFARDAPGSICSYASHNFMLAGILANIYEDLDRMMYLAMQMPADHIALFVSRSGTDKTLVSAAKIARKRGATVVALTADPESALACEASHVLRCCYYPEFRDFGEIIFGASLKYLFDVLFVMAFSKDVDRVLELNRVYDTLYYSELDRAR